MVVVSVAGASGYSGAELLRWLTRHPEVELGKLLASSQAGLRADESFPHLHSRVSVELEEADWPAVGEESDVVFLALPHGLAHEAAQPLLERDVTVIDIGADFRLRSAELYERWYALQHAAPHMLAESVYGLPELNRDQLAGAKLIANPGCYPTASCLGLLPILRAFGDQVTGPVIIDAKSGVSGAGRAAAQARTFAELNEDLSPYGAGQHRHQPEIEQTLATALPETRVFFSPHLIPMTRGILASCYVPVKEVPNASTLRQVFEEAYSDEPFVRLLDGDQLPHTKYTLGSNFCDIAFRVDVERGLVVVFSAIDNLVKGAAGQAVQNMNLSLGFDEALGLEALPVFP